MFGWFWLHEGSGDQRAEGTTYQEQELWIFREKINTKIAHFLQSLKLEVWCRMPSKAMNSRGVGMVKIFLIIYFYIWMQWWMPGVICLVNICNSLQYQLSVSNISCPRSSSTLIIFFSVIFSENLDEVSVLFLFYNKIYQSWKLSGTI